MNAASSPPDDGDVVVHRTPVAARWAFGVLGVFYAASTIVSLAAVGWSVQAAVRLLQAAAWTAMAVLVARWELRVDGEGVTLVRGPWRRHVPWDRVVRLEMVDAVSGWRFVPRLVVRDGRPLRLETPPTGEGDELAARMVERAARAGVTVVGSALTAPPWRWVVAIAVPVVVGAVAGLLFLVRAG